MPDSVARGIELTACSYVARGTELTACSMAKGKTVYWLFFFIYDLVPKGVHENRTKGVENKVDDTLKLVVFLECAQC